MKMVRAWWSTLTPREHLLLGLGGAVMALVIVGQFILIPLFRWHDDSSARHRAAQQQLETISSLSAELRLQTKMQTAAGPVTDNLRVSVTRTARDSAVSISRLQPDASGGLTVWITSVKSADLYAWVATLHANHGVRVVKASFSQNDTDASVRAQLSLMTAASGPNRG